MTLFAMLGCGPDPLLEPYGGDPLWDEIDWDAAQDLGHRVRAVDPVPSGTLMFEDATEALGLGAVAGLGNQHGVGIALVDLDADGWDDLVLANGVSNTSGRGADSVLYWNRQGVFVDGTDSSGIRDLLGGLDTYSIAAGDLDRDGDVDLYVGAQPTNVLLRNRGDGTFEDATAETGAGGPPSDPDLVADGRGKVVNVGDVDGDGWLDLSSASSTLPAPGATLLRNRGDGTWEDWTDRTGIDIATDGNPCAVMFTDYDNDGASDLWIWNDRGGHVLLRNVGGAFENFQNRADRVSIRNPMGIDGADVDHDGDLDYYVSNIGRHPLLVNNGDGTFEDRTEEAGTFGDYGWGLAFEDLDLDGWADLYVTQEDDRAVLAYRNRGDLTFDARAFERPIPVDVGGAAHNVAAAFADVDHDGRVDAAWATTDGSRMVLHRNVTDVGSHRGLEVRIDGGVAARVAVWTPDGLVQFKDVLGGSSRASQNALSVRLGLGDFDGAERVAVLWPDGRQRAFENVPAGTLVVEAP